MGYLDRSLIIKTLNKFNKLKSGDKGGGDFSSNTIEGDHGFDAM